MRDSHSRHCPCRTRMQDQDAGHEDPVQDRDAGQGREAQESTQQGHGGQCRTDVEQDRGCGNNRPVQDRRDGAGKRRAGQGRAEHGRTVQDEVKEI